MKHDLNRNLQWRAKRLYALFACLVLTLPFAVVPAFAADDPLSVVTSLSDFIFSLIRAVGLILLGYGILQVGLSLQSHDPSQRSNGILTIAGGIVITFTKEILTLITGGITSGRERKCVPGHSSSQNVLIVPPPIEDALDLHRLS